MITDKRAGNYVVELDESGDEVLVLDEAGGFDMPRNYREREVALAVANMGVGHQRNDLLISRSTLHAAVQEVRANAVPAWGTRGVC